MAFTASDVKTLREKTGCGMMDCKKALTESNGDMQQAADFLREKGLAAANKKANRIAAEGVALAFINNQTNIGAIIEVNAETDFVAKNADFKSFVELCANTIIEQNPSSVEELLVCKSGTQTIEEALREKILTIGENLKIRRFARFEGVVATYNHADGRIAVMVRFEAEKEAANTPEFKGFAKDIAMQIAAVNPTYLEQKQVPQEVVEHEKKILTEQVINDGKPQQVAEKIVSGRINKFFKEICLLEQPFVKDSNLSVQQYAQETGKKLNTQIQVAEFIRFEKGEGLEKREDNFADEVANMVK